MFVIITAVESIQVMVNGIQHAQLFNSLRVSRALNCILHLLVYKWCASIIFIAGFILLPY